MKSKMEDLFAYSNRLKADELRHFELMEISFAEAKGCGFYLPILCKGGETEPNAVGGN
ncbi:hypothetical protein [Sphingobacterium yanglingense]|nr:hypothetical protein [Sphingobacterium yanglingense]